MKRSVRALVAASIACLLAPSVKATTIFPPDAIVDRESIAGWTAAWVTWAGGLPATGNAFDDPTGAFAGQHNNRPVFFLAGYFSLPVGYSAPPVLRSFSAPAGKPILVALINIDTAAYISSFAASSLTATLDGVPVLDPFQYRETSSLFSAGPLEPDTLGQTIFSTPGFPGVPPGCLPTDLCPAQITGYWASLSPAFGVYARWTSYPLSSVAGAVEEFPERRRECAFSTDRA
jgi:hypothetical protein